MSSDHSGTGDGVAPPPLPIPPPLPAPPSLPPPERHGFVFTGRAGEFFGIWFVNLLLTVLTLGLYSAWAKVRTERYFYGNTRVGGSAFEYLARPLPILYGRLIAYAVVIALGLTWHFQLFYLYFPLLLTVMAVMPFLVHRTLRFRARYSAWRGLRFRFVDGTFEAYVAFMFKPVGNAFTVWMLSPWVQMGKHDYIVRGHRFGGLRFDFRGDLSRYYIPFLMALGAGLAIYVGAIVVGLIGVGVVGATTEAGKADPDAGPVLLAFYAPVAAAYVVLLTLPIFLRSRYTNLMWSATNLGPHRFESTLRARDMVWIYVSNGAAILLTLGLAMPWAMVRLAKYRAAHFALWAYGGLDGFGAERAEAQGAAGAELVDALDWDVGIGL